MADPTTEIISKVAEHSASGASGAGLFYLITQYFKRQDDKKVEEAIKECVPLTTHAICSSSTLSRFDRLDKTLDSMDEKLTTILQHSMNRRRDDV